MIEHDRLIAVQSRDIGPSPSRAAQCQFSLSRLTKSASRRAAPVEPRLRELIGANQSGQRSNAVSTYATNTAALAICRSNRPAAATRTLQGVSLHELPDAAAPSVGECCAGQACWDTASGFDEMQPALLEIARARRSTR